MRLARWDWHRRCEDGRDTTRNTTGMAMELPVNHGAGDETRRTWGQDDC